MLSKSISIAALSTLLFSSIAVAQTTTTMPATATPQLRAYLDSKGDVELMPNAPAGTKYQALNNGQYVTAGGTITLPSGGTLTLPTQLRTGMVINSRGTVITPSGVVQTQKRRVIMPRRTH